MRGLLMVLPVLTLLTLPPCLQAGSGSAAEANLLSLFGLGRRPRVDRRRAVIPPAMLELYRRQTGQDMETSDLPLPGRHTRSANTVRSFTHTGKEVFTVPLYNLLSLQPPLGGTLAGCGYSSWTFLRLVLSWTPLS